MLVIDGVVAGLEGWTENIAQSGVSAFGLSVALGSTDFIGALEIIQRAIEVIRADPDHFVLARSAAEVRAAKEAGRTAFLLYLQGGRPIEDDLSRLDLLRELGVGRISLAHNERSFIADGCLESSNAGLSNFGRKAVRAMNRANIVIDLSHVGERSSLEAMELSERPCVFSHSNPRKLVDNPRNITDEQIRRCADAGGVVGACPWGPIAWGGGLPPGIDCLIEHLEYLVALTGIDHVGVSTDTFIATNQEVMTKFIVDYDNAYPSIVGSFVARFGHDAETMTHRAPVRPAHLPRLTARLVERGWGPDQIAKVMGGNFLRVWEEVWGA